MDGGGDPWTNTGWDQDGSGDGNESSSGDGNGDEDGNGNGDEDGNGNGNGDRIGKGKGEVKKRKKPHKNCRRDLTLSFCARYHPCRQGVALEGTR